MTSEVFTPVPASSPLLRRAAAFTIMSVGLVLAFLLYRSLSDISGWITHDLFGLAEGSRVAGSVEFFLYDVPKVFLLLTAVVFVVGVLQSYFTPARARRLLAGRESGGNVIAAMLGTITPFCSCSAVPLFIGFVTSGIPLGVTFSFLIAAPMINEVALVMLFGLFGWKVGLLYFATGLAIAIVSGWIIGKMRMEKYVESWVYEREAAAAGSDRVISYADRLRVGRTAVREVVGKIAPYVIAGIAIGAVIHGYVPTNFMASIMGKDAWWAVPLAVVLGIPMYSGATGMIPIVQALLGKGAALGTVLAFMMAVIGLSAPEIIILRKVLRPRLIATFIGVVGTGILAVGYLFNAVL